MKTGIKELGEMEGVLLECKAEEEVLLMRARRVQKEEEGSQLSFDGRREVERKG